MIHTVASLPDRQQKTKPEYTRGNHALCVTRPPSHNTLPDGHTLLRLLAARSRSSHFLLSLGFNSNDQLAQGFILKRWGIETLRK